MLTFGRSALSDIVIDDAKASRSHARLHFGDGVLLEDLASTNGTMVGETLVTSHRLLPGEVIRIGDHRIQLDTAASAIDFDRTVVNTEAEIEPTLVANPLDVEVNDTTVPRLAITTRTATWEVPLEGDKAVIGRGSECDILIESQQVSRAHAQVERAGDGFRVRDLGSSNGTWLAGRRVSQEPLRDGDSFTVGDARCVFKAGFSNDELTIADMGPQRGKRRPVVFVPGMMGSKLYLGSELVWPNVRLMMTNPQIFAYGGKEPLRADGLVDEVVVVPNLIKQDQYNRLTEYLCEGLSYEIGRDLFAFAYDWRQDVRATARQLGAAIESWDIREPITIITHSLGTLVSRYYIDCLGGSRRVERAIYMGGPHYGVPKSVVVLSQGRGFFPFGLFAEKVRALFATFPTAHQILPVHLVARDQHNQPIDVLADDRWVPEAQRAAHAMARELRRELPDRSGVPAVSIFGYGSKTVSSISMRRGDDGLCHSLEFVSEDSGDSAIPQNSTVLRGTEIHPVRQQHGALYTDKDVQMRLKLELTR
jgi:pSer/pThr/pTyr-binding forkhead associated (FHA) protein